MPTELDGRVGGQTVSHFGPGMDSLSTITVWDPPRRFVADSRDALRWLAQMSVLTVHMWHSRGASLDSPDWMLFDLDPAKESFNGTAKITVKLDNARRSIWLHARNLNVSAARINGISTASALVCRTTRVENGEIAKTSLKLCRK